MHRTTRYPVTCVCRARPRPPLSEMQDDAGGLLRVSGDRLHIRGVHHHCPTDDFRCLIELEGGETVRHVYEGPHSFFPVDRSFMLAAPRLWVRGSGLRPRTDLITLLALYYLAATVPEKNTRDTTGKSGIVRRTFPLPAMTLLNQTMKAPRKAVKGEPVLAYDRNARTGVSKSVERLAAVELPLTVTARNKDRKIERREYSGPLIELSIPLPKEIDPLMTPGLYREYRERYRGHARLVTLNLYGGVVGGYYSLVSTRVFTLLRGLNELEARLLVWLYARTAMNRRRFDKWIEISAERLLGERNLNDPAGPRLRRVMDLAEALKKLRAYRVLEEFEMEGPGLRLLPSPRYFELGGRKQK